MPRERLTLLGVVPLTSWNDLGVKSFFDSEGISNAMLRRKPVIIESVQSTGNGSVSVRSQILTGEVYKSSFITYSREEVNQLNKRLKRGALVCTQVDFS